MTIARSLLVACLVLVAGRESATCAVLQVPAQYRTVQAAIHAAGNGDTVLVAPGTYRETIDFLGKAIVVKSSHGPEVTTIDGGGAGSVVTFTRGEGPKSVLEGFTITHGRAARGGGIHIDGASPTIVENVITDNFAVDDGAPGVAPMGGGIYCSSSNATITGNTIHQNKAAKTAYSHALVSGGGIHAESSSPVITANVISSNVSDATWSRDARGGGIRIVGGISARIVGNTIEDNSVGAGGEGAVGGGVCCEGTSPALLNNVVIGNEAHAWAGWGGGIVIVGGPAAIVAGNLITDNVADGMWALGAGVTLIRTPATVFTGNTVAYNENKTFGMGGAGLWAYHTSLRISNSIFWRNVDCEDYCQIWPESSTISGVCCLIQKEKDAGWTGPGPGIIHRDPLFVDAAKRDYHLTWESPCRDSGDRASVPPGPFADFEGDPRIAGTTVDIGADEFFPHLYHAGNATPGGTVTVTAIGPPGQAVTWAFSAVTPLLSPPLTLPGIAGDWRLNWPFFPIALGTTSGRGLASAAIRLPPGLPAPRAYPAQALVGARFTNVDAIRVR